jgi:hypothetical protein
MIQGQIIKIGKAIKIINTIRIINLTNENILKIMDFNKTTQGVSIVVRKDMSERNVLYGRNF